MTRITYSILFWWFLVGPYGTNYTFSVIGPFANQAQCEKYRAVEKWATVGPSCWDDGRDRK